MPMNFANGKIYAIRSHQTEQIYIGSTCQPLYKRFHQHKRKPCSSSQILQFEDAFIELLEEFPCVNKMQLNRREGELIRLHNCVNQQIAGRTDAEWYQDNKEDKLEKTKQWYENNKEQRQSQMRKYVNEHKEQKKQYNENNKEHIKQQKGKSNICGCGIQYTNGHKQRHFKTPNHLEFIRQLSA